MSASPIVRRRRDRREAPRSQPKPSRRRALVSADWLVVGEPFASTAPIRPPPPSRNCCSTTCCARSGVSRGSGGREGRACHLAVEEAAGRATSMPRSPRCGRAASSPSAAPPRAALLGVDEPLGKLRERVHERGGIPVVVTFALPYLLRHAADKPRAWADLCRAVAAIA